MILARIRSTSAPAATVLIRLMVGAIFFSEGLQKFLRPAEVGAGRFAKIGLPAPETLAPLVGGFEVVCGALVLAGILTRVATIPLIAIITSALITTKIPILLERGFWSAAHEARTDVAMLLGLIFLLILGAGRPSWDARHTSA